MAFNAHLKYESSKSSQKNCSFHSVEEKCQNNLLIVQNYFTQKVKIIQKWWREILARKKAELKVLSDCKISLSPESELFPG